MNNNLQNVFVDLCARPRTTEDAIEMLDIYKKVGYKAVFFEYLPYLDKNNIKKVAATISILIGWRTTLYTNKFHKIIQKIKELKKNNILISIVPTTLEAARQAARHRGVDVLTIEPGMERILDPSTLKLFEQRSWGAAEIILVPLLRAWDAPDRRLEATLRYIFIAAKRASGYKIPLIVSSCAEKPWDIFHPKHIIGLLSLSNLPEEETIRWITSTPYSIAKPYFS